MNVATEQPITTLAGHIAALQRAGAVAIWPLDDPVQGDPGDVFWGDTRRVWDTTGQYMVATRLTGLPNEPLTAPRFGIPGPYPDATAFQGAPFMWGLYSYPEHGAQQDPFWAFPATWRLPAFSQSMWMCLSRHRNLALAQPVAGEIWMQWLYYVDTWARTYVPLWFYSWAGEFQAAGVSWEPAQAVTDDGSVNVMYWGPEHGNQRDWDRGEDHWIHFVAVFDNLSFRLYMDGELLGDTATYRPQGFPPGGDMTVQPYNFSLEGPAGLSALAFFDRALTEPEVKSLLYAAPAPEGAARVWDGTEWVPGQVRGWDGSQWRGAKVWDGQGWREL